MLVMEYLSNVSLKEYNTFGIDVKAEKFISVESLADLKKVVKEHKDLFLLFLR